MGFLSGSDSENLPKNSILDSTCVDTQPFYSQSPLDEKGHDNNDFQLRKNSVPFTDAFPVGDVLETQVLDLSGETQAVDDAYHVENTNMQLFDDFDDHVSLDIDGQSTDGTEVLNGKEEQSDDELGERGHSELVNLEKNQHPSISEDAKKEISEQTNSMTSKRLNSGSGPRFASMGAESLRASGLAAKCRLALKGAETGSCFFTTSNHLSRLHTTEHDASKAKPLEEVEPAHDTTRHNNEVKGLRNGSKVGGSATARKLFTEDSLVESDDKTVGRNELPHLPYFDDRLAGLSYLDSQEPGESLQANALACVQKLISESRELFDNEFPRKSSCEAKPDHISSGKGLVSLAKRTKDRDIKGQSGIFDWDDMHEDEGGGDIFVRKKEELIGSKTFNRRSLTNPDKPHGKRLDGSKDKERKSKVQNTKIFQSDSKVVSRSLKVNNETTQETEMNIRRNLIHDFQETDIARKDPPKTLNIGLDTQMAAEAMEALLNGEGIANDAHVDLPENCNCPPEASQGRKARKTIGSTHCSSHEHSSTGVSTRRSKITRTAQSELSKPVSIASAKDTMDAKNDGGSVQVLTRSKRAKFTAEGIPVTGGRKIPNDVGSKKRKLPGELASFTPIARRTRRSLVVSEVQVSGNLPYCCELKSELKTAHSLDVDVHENNREDAAFVDNMKAVAQTDSLSCPRRKRSSRNSSRQPDTTRGEGVKLSKRKKRDSLLSDKDKKYCISDKSPTEKNMPVCATPDNVASPVCAGDGYVKQSCKKSLPRTCLLKEINRLMAREPEPTPTKREMRKRRDLVTVRVLFSNHLDDDIIKQQKKFVDRLKVSVASSIKEATHFITDKFVRTRNMLEAIASGKPVVTHLWLENVALANYYVDEEKYILRDTRKEKEFGFNMAVSLAHARQHPLLQGRRVLVTPNAKPGKETVKSLIKAVHGQALERIGRSALSDKEVPDDLLILSCEEDYELCIPFLEKGAAVYTSELLLNGIVTQRLEYERHRLFADNVKRTRSTIWMKKDGHNFIPVNK